jgi:hypothetical protein
VLQGNQRATAKYLLHSDKHAKGDVVPSKEWLLVSQLCDATVYLPLKHHSSFFECAERDHDLPADRAQDDSFTKG